MNHYETVFILTPVLSDTQMKEAVDKFKSVLTAGGAVITHEDNWGLRKLAYPIQKKTTGFYNLLQFDAEPHLIATLETQYRRDERVLRFLTFHLDKYAYEYAEKRKNHKKEQPDVLPAEQQAEDPIEQPVEQQAEQTVEQQAITENNLIKQEEE
ncbi:MAG: 30S ribosomal protein S6 [Prevotellaceae bacterium]|jgi:small subunit ribosomal protein S6|nr:30S ribosomal protein S6 [Prevotellaceae bacterium]